MLTKPPLVPSKHALKVLRQLALAGSTVAAVGVVTVSYEVHRRIRLAEQRLETKRQIRAISGGKGEAYIARVIEAAENGEDFSIQAMREQRIRERRFEPSQLAMTSNEGSREHRPDTPGLPHNERGHLDRQFTAHKIRKATMTMTSTAPEHIYGRPKRFRKPAPSWPTVESREAQAPETPALSARKNTLYAREEAAEMIKKATMAMTSTAPAHVYGRPKKAVPKSRPNLHGPVASWLGTAIDSQTSTNIASELIDSSSTITRADIVSRHTSTATSRGMETVEHTAGEALHHLDSSAAEAQTRLCRLTFAGDFDTTTSVQDRQEQHTSEIRQKTDGNETASEALNKSDQGPHVKSPNHDILSVGSCQTSQSVASTPFSQDAIEAEYNTANDASMSNETLDIHSRRLRPGASPFDSRDSSEQVEQSLSSQETLSANSQSPDAKKHRDNDSPSMSVKGDGAPSDSATPANHAFFPSKPCRHIQLQQSTNEAHQSDFTPWPHLQALHGSDFCEGQDNLWSLDEGLVNTQQPVSREDPDAHSKEIRDEQHQVIHKWTPFPRSVRSPERTIDQLNIEQDPVSANASWPVYHRDEFRRSENVSGASILETSATPFLTAEEKVGLALQIQSIFLSDGSTEGQRAWIAAAKLRLRHNDLACVDFLYAEFVERGVVGISPRHHIVQSLIQCLFKRSKYSARAAEILFPNQPPDPVGSAGADFGRPCRMSSLYQEDRLASTFAIRFLQGLWETRADSDWLLLNFRRVIVAAKLRGAKLVEEIFAVVIRFLASTGDMPSAQAIYDEMVFYHQIEASFLSRTLLLRGYARMSDWYRVEREIESVHVRGLSRSRPHGYALMINNVLQEYAARASIEQLQNFLINAISYWGLVPTSSISMTTVQAYLSCQRYDLVREWMETLQVLFPQIETETSRFQWLLGNFWQTAGANCQEIEEATKAVAYHNPYSKLRSSSVPLIHEALSRDLAAKIDAAKVKTQPTGQLSCSSSTEDSDFVSTKTLDEYLTSAFSVAASTVLQHRKPTPEVIDLHRQVTAAQRLNAFLTGAPSSEAVDQFSFPDPESDTVARNINVNRGSAPTTSSIYHLHDTIPTVLTAEFLPETSTIVAAILDFYHVRSVRDLSTDHALLPWVCQKLLHADRAFDAVLVLQKVYGSNIVKQLAGLKGEDGNGFPAEVHGTKAAVGFAIQFFEFWMRLAEATRSLVQWKRVVEEVLHLSTPGRTLSYRTEGGVRQKMVLNALGITSSFLFLTRSVAARALRGRSVRWRSDVSRGPVKELTWMVKELEKRREQQIGRREGNRGFRVKQDILLRDME